MYCVNVEEEEEEEEDLVFEIYKEK